MEYGVFHGIRGIRVEYGRIQASGRSFGIRGIRIQSRGLGTPLVVQRTLRSATGGASEWRPPLAWCVVPSPESPRHHRRPPQLPEVPAGPRHTRHFLRSQGHSPWASCWRNHLKAGAHAPAMDYVSSSRARASLTTARALQQEYPCRTATNRCSWRFSGLSSASLHRMNSVIVVGFEETRSAPRRISSQIRRGVRLKAQGSAGGSGPGACQMRVQIPRRSRAPPPPARGGMSVREFCVPVPVLHLLLPRQSHENPLYSAAS